MPNRRLNSDLRHGLAGDCGAYSEISLLLRSDTIREGIVLQQKEQLFSQLRVIPYAAHKTYDISDGVRGLEVKFRVDSRFDSVSSIDIPPCNKGAGS